MNGVHFYYNVKGECIMNEKYPVLLSPGKIGNVEIRNKTVMCAMGMNQADHGYVSEAVINHYVERAKGGVGLIMVEVTCVDAPQGQNTTNPMFIDDDKYIPRMNELTDAIHKEGAKVFLQISHAGRGAFRAITGMDPVAPSAVAMPYSFMMGLSNETPRALTIDEIHAIEEKYAQGALRAKKAGFDGVEIHSTGYYLGEQFLSSVVNQRTDEYGGNPENRVRFHLNIINRIHELCGEDFPIVVKLSAMELGEHGGITFEEGVYYAKRFQDVGVDAIEVLAGSWKTEADETDIQTSATPDCQAVGACAGLKYGIMQMTGEPAKIQMIGGGHAQNPVVAEKVLEEGQCEFIFIGHGLLVQPDLVKLIDEDREDEIRPCIGCGVCIDVQLQSGATCACSGNAVLGQGNNDYTIPPAETRKKVVVVGGGVAGVEAARVASTRGHDVSLYDKSNEIGGQMHYAVIPPQKDHMAKLAPFLAKQLVRTGVNTHLGTALTTDQILEMKPDVVICATGVKPAKLPIPGFEKALSAKEVLDGAECGENVVIIGGGSVGCETAEFIAAQGKNVTIVEMLDDVAEKMVKVTRTVLLGHLKHYGVTILTSCSVKEIRDDAIVYADKGGNVITLPADTVVVSVGDKPDSSLYDELKEKADFEVYNIGDSAGAGTIVKAVNQAYYLALGI